jgi:hypothetical protein
LRRHPARIVLFVLALVIPAILAACGGSSSSSSSSADPQTVLNETFNNNTKVTSGNLNLSLSVDATGTQSANFTASLDGPFQSDAKNTGALPQLDLTAKVAGSGAGQNVNFQGGVTATSDQAFVTYQNQAYAVPAATFQQLKTAYAAQAQSAAGSSSSSNASSVLKQLGIDPSTWLTNVTNEGTADVEGASTTHISGDANVSQILSDLGKAAQNVPGAASQGIDPTTLQAASAFIKNAHIDVYSGTDDHLLRKLDVSLEIQPPPAAAQGISDLKLNLSISVSNVNQPQTIAAPSNPKPLSDLQQQLGGAGILGQLGGGTSSLPGSSGGSSGSGTSSSSPSSAAQAAYAKCVLQASQSGNAAAANKCLALLK